MNLHSPWPWYVAGPLIGLTVPLLLIVGNKALGISSSFRHICAACLPANISFFRYDWKKYSWNLFFVAGVVLGGFLVYLFLQNPYPVQLNAAMTPILESYGIRQQAAMIPQEIFNLHELLTLRGIIVMVFGGMLVGFGTRYAGGCTSGHAIMGLSNLQFPSLIATICFMVGGFVMANFILPIILKL